MAHTGRLRALHQGASVLGGLTLQMLQEGCSPEQMAISTPLVNNPQCWRSRVLALSLSPGRVLGGWQEDGNRASVRYGCCSGQNQGPGQASGKRSNLWEFPGSPGVGTWQFVAGGNWVPILGQGTKIPKLCGTVKLLKNKFFKKIGV